LYGSPPGGASYADAEAKAPWWLLFVAATFGLIGVYAFSAVFPSHGEGLKIPVPDPSRSIDLVQLVLMLLPAVVGAVLAAAYLVVKFVADRALLALSTDVRVRVLVGSACFALLIALWPDMHSNGQVQLDGLSAHPEIVGPWLLLANGLVTAIGLAVCLAAGWLGGPIMPLSFVGVCGGLAVSQVLPGLDPGFAAIAGAAAASCVGMNKPLVALLVLVFLTTHPAPIAIAVDVGVGVLLLRAMPQTMLEHAGHQ
jgi:H+/Cl- antiporter ClcA